MPKFKPIIETMRRMNINSNGSSEGGFTLIEVMIAMAIFTIGVLGVFAMQTNSMMRSGNSVKSTQAGFWVQDRVESLMLLPYDDVQLNTVSSAAGGLINRTTQGPYNISWVVFSNAENGTSIGGYANLTGDPMFANVNRTLALSNIRANTKFVMVHVSHPLGERSRVTFLRPNI